MSLSIEELVQRQSNALRDTILEAKKAESMRIRKLQDAHNEQRQHELNERFKKERLQDENKIKNLMNDLEVLKVKVKDGEVNQKIIDPATILLSKLDMKSNRFAQYEDANDMRFRAGVVKRFEQQDKVFLNNQNKPPPFNYYDEKVKVILYFIFYISIFYFLLFLLKLIN